MTISSRSYQTGFNTLAKLCRSTPVCYNTSVCHFVCADNTRSLESVEIYCRPYVLQDLDDSTWRTGRNPFAGRALPIPAIKPYVHAHYACTTGLALTQQYSDNSRRCSVKRQSTESQMCGFVAYCLQLFYILDFLFTTFWLYIVQ